MDNEVFLAALKALVVRAHPIYHAYRVAQVKAAIDALPTMTPDDWAKHYGGECLAAIRSIDQDLRYLEGAELRAAAVEVFDRSVMDDRAAAVFA